MPEWFIAIKDALPVVMALGLLIWMAVVYHGDTRWLKRPEAMDAKGDVRWSPKETVEQIHALVLGQNDSIAGHDNRLSRIEEREETILGHLTSLTEKMDDVRDSVARLEERSEHRRQTDRP